MELFGGLSPKGRKNGGKIKKDKNLNYPFLLLQEWLGHADFSTTANIYSHLDYKTKIDFANTISNVFDFDNKKRRLGLNFSAFFLCKKFDFSLLF